MNKQKGSGLIEVVFSVGVIVLVIVAVVSLIIKTVTLKTLAEQRKKANEMTEIIIEGLLEKEKMIWMVFGNLIPFLHRHCLLVMMGILTMLFLIVLTVVI